MPEQQQPRNGLGPKIAKPSYGLSCEVRFAINRSISKAVETTSRRAAASLDLWTRKLLKNKDAFTAQAEMPKLARLEACWLQSPTVASIYLVVALHCISRGQRPKRGAPVQNDLDVEIELDELNYFSALSRIAEILASLVSPAWS